MSRKRFKPVKFVSFVELTDDVDEYCTECGVVTVPRSECCGAQIDDFGYCKECREHCL